MREFLEGKIKALQDKFIGYEEVLEEKRLAEENLARINERLVAYEGKEEADIEIANFIELGRLAGFLDGIFYKPEVVPEVEEETQEVDITETPSI